MALSEERKLPIEHRQPLNLSLRQTNLAKLNVPLRKLLAALAVTSLLLWLASSEANPWRSERFIRSTVYNISPPTEVSLINELLPSIAGIQQVTTLQVNKPWRPDALNVYILDKLTSPMEGWGAGGASYEPTNDVILIDRYVIWPYLTKVGFASANVAHANLDWSSADRLWLQFVFLHELGHRVLHRNVRLERQRLRQFEDEADLFAFKQMAKLMAQSEGTEYNRPGLLSRRAIARLPEPDRGAAIIASLIQEYSISLLFSNASVSTYSTDAAHRAFVDRFKPRLLEALTTTKTRAGRTFILITIAAVDRVERSGRSVVAEFLSDYPVTAVWFDGADLKVEVDTGKGPTKTGVATRSQSQYSAQSTIGEKLSPIEVGAPVPNETRRDRHWWVDRPPIEATRLDEVLLALLRSQYGDDMEHCTVSRRPRTYPMMDVVFTCRVQDIDGTLNFIGSYNIKSNELAELAQLKGPAEQKGDERFSIEILDAQVSGKRRIVFVQNTFSDMQHNKPHQLRTFGSEGNDTRFLSKIDLISDEIPTGSAVSDWFDITHPQTLICEEEWEEFAICTEFFDSVFQVNLRTGDVQPLFYPAGIKRAGGPSGYQAFYVPGGFRVFVSKLGRIARD
jgi:hypothetical protein